MGISIMGFGYISFILVFVASAIAIELLRREGHAELSVGSPDDQKNGSAKVEQKKRKTKIERAAIWAERIDRHRQLHAMKVTNAMRNAIGANATHKKVKDEDDEGEDDDA